MSYFGNNSPHPPLRIGNYYLEKTVGSGSFGKVKKGTHVVTGVPVAVKIINKEKLAKKSDMDQKIRREIFNLKRFRHPHIIKLYEVIETQTDIFLVMELVGGGELFDYIIQRGKLSEVEGRLFFQQMISAVGYCHHHKVAHRDLKPENLLLSSTNNSLKIADFGLSNLIQDGEFLQTSCGSPNYAAPEVIDGKYYSGEEIDVWSSGVILYALLTARLPFDDDYIPHLFSKIKRGKYKMPSFLSGPCQDLIKQMLIVDPLKRITIPEIKNHPWFKTDLPPYLRDFPDDNIDPHEMFRPENLDEQLLQELQHMYSMNRSKLLAEISKEVEFCTMTASMQSNAPFSHHSSLSQSVPQSQSIPQSRSIPQSVSIGSVQGPSLLSSTPSSRLNPSLQYAGTPGGLSSTPSSGSILDGTVVLDSKSTPLMVAYLLLYDQAENDLTPAAASTKQNQGRFSAQRDSVAQSLAELSTSPPMNLREEIPFLDSGSELNVLAAMNNQSKSLAQYEAEAALENAQGQTPNQQIRPWYLGILSRKPPNAIMKEVYRALKKLSFEWKIISPYQIQARSIQNKTNNGTLSVSPTNHSNLTRNQTDNVGGPTFGGGRESIRSSSSSLLSSNYSPRHSPRTNRTSQLEVPRAYPDSPTTSKIVRTSASGYSSENETNPPLPLVSSMVSDGQEQYVKLVIQLFVVNPRKDSQSIVHLLDFKKLQGPPLAFFDMCGTLMQELKI